MVTQCRCYMSTLQSYCSQDVPSSSYIQQYQHFSFPSTSSQSSSHSDLYLLGFWTIPKQCQIWDFSFIKWFDFPAFLTNTRKTSWVWRENVGQKFHYLISTKNAPASEQTQVPYYSWNLSINAFSELTSEMDIILALQRIKRDYPLSGATHWVTYSSRMKLPDTHL